MLSNHTCDDISKLLGIPSAKIASILNLKRLVQEEQLVEAAPLVNCYLLAALPSERQEALFDAAITMEPRRFEEICR